MTTQKHSHSDHVVDLLPAYINQQLELRSREHVDAHLQHCRQCQLEFMNWEAIRDATRFATEAAPLPSANILDQVWAKIDDLSQEEAIPHQTVKDWVAHLWLVFKMQVPLIHKSIWIASAIVIFTGCALAIRLLGTSTHEVYKAEFILALFASVVAPAGMAFIYGTETDPGVELTLSTPTSIRVVILCRLMLVTGYNFMLASLASAMLALVHGGNLWEVMQLWVGPVILMSSISLVLSLMVSSAFSLITTLLIEAIQTIISRLPEGTFNFHLATSDLWQTNPLMLLLALSLITLAILYAPRQTRFAN